ncbi:tyrosinase family oxidase copper chaperone [Streptomyces sp. NPDC050704]|uniref:tyrosinase family oxidase copper chaperone n=1 Tax=Streptomyces sp. NPDC050704 TaxID=3157219 RepID=UPI00341250A9
MVVGRVPVRAVNGRRRDVLRALLASAVAVALAPLVAASRPSRADSYGPGGSGGSGAPARSQALDGFDFDEMYRGRRIRGLRDAAGGVRLTGADRAAAAGRWQVTVDDRPLHVMRRADGSYLTMVDHYQSYPTPLAAARAAVDELGTSLRLRAAAVEAEGVDRVEGHGHGVHA